jgi:outer membrane protein TolC
MVALPGAERSCVESRKTVKGLRVELKHQGALLQQVHVARDEAQAAARVIGEERQQMKSEWADMFSAHDGLKSKISDLSERLWSAEQALQVCRASDYVPVSKLPWSTKYQPAFHFMQR